MNEEIDLIALIEKDILGFDGVSRFPDPGFSENIQKAIGMGGHNPGVKTSEDDWDGPNLRDETAVLHPVRTQYAAFFSQPSPIPTEICTPPLDTSALTLEDVRRMTSGEINRNWSQICAALMQHG